MFGLNQRSPLIKVLSSSILVGLLSWGLLGCSDRLTASSPVIEPSPVPVTTTKFTEVAPPTVIQELKEVLAQYHPRVTIISPKPQQMFSETTVPVQLEVKDYPLFKDETLGLGPHLHLFVDNQPYRAVYNLDEPIILEDLTPGTHTIRVFASRPWHESFKNEGAYAQTTFSVFTETEDNSPSSSLPLLTYSRPQGSYGAEPIMLDFYLTNAPLHFIAQSDPNDEIIDWRIKATINGESFLIDTWQPIYLKGFEPGKNWVQLEFIDEQGKEVNNAFNDTVRVITYEPNGEDTLSKLIRGELSVEVARSVVDPNYIYTLEPEPIEEETPPTTVEETREPQEPVEESASEPIISPTSENTTEEDTEPLPISDDTITRETEMIESGSPSPETIIQQTETIEPLPASDETITQETENPEPLPVSSETVTPSKTENVTEEPETIVQPTEPENDTTVTNDDISLQDSSETVTQDTSTPLSETIQPETVTPSSQELPQANKVQWVQKLVDFFKNIDFSGILDKLNPS